MSWPAKASGGGAPADTGISAVAATAIPANRLIYITGTGQMALADATAEGKETVGFTKAATNSGEVGKYYTNGVMSGLSGLTAGSGVFTTTAPGVAGAAPNGANNVVQRVGTATSATELVFTLSMPITLSA